jgi:hypothetical protein
MSTKMMNMKMMNMKMKNTKMKSLSQERKRIDLVKDRVVDLVVRVYQMKQTI